MPGARQSSRARRRRLLAATLTAALVPAVAAQAAITTEPNRSRVSFDGGGPATVELVRNGIVIGHAPGVTDSANRVGQCWAGFTPQVRAGDTVRVAAQSMTVQGPLTIAAPTGDPLTGNWSAAGTATGAGPFAVSLPDVGAGPVPVSSGPFTAPFNVAIGTTPEQAQIDAGSGDITRVRSDDPTDPLNVPAAGCPPFNTDAVTAVDAGHLIGGAPVISAANAGTDLTLAGPTGTEGPVTATLGGATRPTTGSGGTWSAAFTPAQLAALPEGPLVAGIGAGATLPLLKDTLAPAQPTSSPPPGRYLNAPTVSLAAEPGSRIHFTSDGSTPTTASPVYTAPIRVGSSSTIRAFAIDAVGNAGPVAALAYQLGPGAGSSGGAPDGTNSTANTTKPGGATKPGAARITVLKISKRVSLRRLRKDGLGVGVQLTQGTGAVRFMVYRRATRKKKTSYRLVASVVRSPTTPRYRTRLNARALGLVRTGVYRLRIVPGVTRTTLDSDAARTIFLRVVR